MISQQSFVVSFALDGHLFFSVENSNMQKVNLFTLYSLGKVLGNLSEVFHSDVDNSEKWRPVTDAIAGVSFFIKQTENVSLKNTQEIAQKLFDAIKKYSDSLHSDSPPTEEAILGHKVAINFLIQEFDQSFKRESDERIRCFLVTNKGLYDTIHLIENAEIQFAPEVIQYLPDESISDLREAGRCLAFDCPTAMAFHLFRATETVILKYYELLRGQNPKEKSRNWSVYIKALKNLQAPRAITQRLNEIKDLERNPIIHPKHAVKLENALPLFNLCGGVIPLMAQEIEKLEAAKNES